MSPRRSFPRARLTLGGGVEREHLDAVPAQPGRGPGPDEQGKIESLTVEPDVLGLFDHVLNTTLRDSEAS